MTAPAPARSPELEAALQRPRRPRWTRAEQTRHRADLIAALTGQAWDQPIPARRTTRRRAQTGTHRKANR